MDPPKVRLELRKSGKKRKQPHVIAFGTEQDPGKTARTKNTNEQQPPLVIPVVPNSTPKFVTSIVEEDERAAAALMEATMEHPKDRGDAAMMPIRSSSTTADNNDDQLYKHELEQLPQELAETDDAYDRVPIADFGAALLRGMGWQGEETAADQADTTKLPRPHRLGLGAVPKPMNEITHRPLRPDEYEKRKKQRQQHQEYQAQHETKRLADPQQTLQDGSIVYLADASSVRARIVQLRGVPGLNRIRVSYERDRNVTSIQKSQIDRLVPRQELLQHPFEDPMPDTTSSTHPAEVHSSSIDNDEKQYKKKTSKKSNERSPGNDPEDWLIPHIRVRIITKKLGKSHYKAKGLVVDVTTKGATLQMPDGSLLDRVPTKYVETALPKVGGSCIIVGRKHWQTKGRLLERSSHKAIIQENENGTALTVHLDDLAEWCGSEEETNF